MIKRLIEFYRRSHEGGYAMMSDIWKGSSKQHAPFCKALLDGDETEVRTLLENIGTSNKLFGLENGKLYTFDDSVAAPYVQRLANLSGVRNYKNPQQPSATEHWKVRDVNATIQAIEDEIGATLRVPPCFGFSGDGAPIRMIMYYSAAGLSVRRMLGGGHPMDILEIGAGCGNLGWLAYNWGSDSYTVIDLPHVAVLSAWFMSHVANSDRVWLFGEPENESSFARFYPCTNCVGVWPQRFDLIFNCDSLPEMPKDVQDMYLRLIAGGLTSDGRFLSINHEGDQACQSSVLDAAKRNGRLNLISRHPFGMMDGYVEEVYKL